MPPPRGVAFGQNIYPCLNTNSKEAEEAQLTAPGKGKQKKMDAKKKEIEEAVAYCRENNCKGYKAYLP